MRRAAGTDRYNQDREMTLEEIAKELGITKQGVRDIEQRALKKLRRSKLRRFVRLSLRHTVLVLLAIISACSWRPGPATKGDFVRHGVMTGLMVVDWRQTVEIANNGAYHEISPLIGSHPSEGRVNTYFALSWLFKTAVALVLPGDEKPEPDTKKTSCAVEPTPASSVEPEIAATYQVEKPETGYALWRGRSWRTRWQYIHIGISAGCVGHNLSIGLSGEW